MVLRTARERVYQTLAFEAGGLALVTPLYVILSGDTGTEGATLVVALAVAVMIWSPLHNTVFDALEWTFAARVASDRPPRWRVVHAVSHEITSLVVTLPVILWLTDYGVLGALLVDLGLTAFYAVYAYVFHVVYDRLRPVSREVA
jgi:uncharacterized membrane protein